MSNYHKSKERILFILHLPPPIHGAALVGKYIESSTLINKEFCTRYINLATSTKLTESGKGSIKKVVGLFKIQLEIIRALLKNRFDLCYVTLNSSGPGFYKDLLVVILLKIFQKKTIYHFHNKGVALSEKSKINHFLYRFVFKDSKCILLSPKLFYDIKHYVEENNVYYCPNGVSFKKGVDYIQLTRQLDMCRLLFLSNMMKDKGVLVLLDACKLLKEKGLSFTCDFVGGWADITEEAFNRVVVENGLFDIIKAHGPKYDQEKSDFYAKANVFVLPTYNDAFPLVHLEAMHHGLAIVSTSEGGIPDIVVDEQTGFLVPKGDVLALVQKLELLILDPRLREKMGIEAKKRFEIFFTLERFEQNLTSILKKAITD